MFEDIKITINGNEVDLSETIDACKECNTEVGCADILDAVKYELENVAGKGFPEVQVYVIPENKEDIK